MSGATTATGRRAVSAVHVVLAGGGTAGHIEPALALADALRRARPDVGITALGTERGLETRLVPGARLRAGADPAGAAAAPARAASCSRVPGRLRARGRGGRARSSTRTEADVRRRLRRLRRRCPPTSPPAAAGVPIVVHEANARPGLANRLGARLTPLRRDGHARTRRCAHAPHVGIPLRRAIATLDRAAVRGRGARARFGLRPRPCRPCWSSAARRAPARLNEAVVRRRADARCAPASRCCTRSARSNDVAARATACRAARRTSSVPYLDRMDLAYAAADLDALPRAAR